MKRVVAIITSICMLMTLVPALASGDNSTDTAFIKSYYEYFEYPANLGSSVSTLENWSVDNENLNESTTGSTVKLAKSPDDEENTVMHVKCLRDYSSAGVNQYAVYAPNADLSADYAVYTADYKIPDVKNDYVTYIKGNITNANGTTREVNLSQLVFRAAGVFEFIGSAAEYENSSVPRGRWFNLAVVFCNKNQTFDLYVDRVKINKQPIKIYAYTEGAAVTSISRIQLGVARYSGVASDMYMDNIKILTFDGATAAHYDLDDVAVPESIDNGYKLLSTGQKFASTITWQSSNTNVLNITNGVAVLGDISSDAEITLTATATNGGKTVTRTYKTLVAGDKGRISKITSGLNSNIVSGQKYVKDNFTVNIPGIMDTDVVTVASSDSSIVLDGLNATVVRGDADKYVDLTINVKSALGNEVSKTVSLYVLSKGVEFYYDGIEYDNFENKQITGADEWTVANENTDASVTGSFQTVKSHSEDSTDKYLDIQVFRKYAPGNQVATLNRGYDLSGRAVVQMNLKFPGTENNRYIMYTTGTFINEDETKFYASTSQIYFYPNTGTILCETYKDTNGKQVAVNSTPFGTDWFNLKLVYDNINLTYDVYINNIKQNTSPIDYGRKVEGEKVINMGNIRFGVHRDSGNPGHMYFDDLLVRAEETDILNHELESVRIPTTFVYDYPLPVTPQLFADVELKWESSDETIITNEGKVNRKTGFGTTPVTLTVTAKREGVSKSKDYPVELVNTPPYTIDNVVFEKSDGSITYTPEAKGKVKNISITKYDSANYANAKAIVAIFDGGKLVSMSQPIGANASGTYTVDMAIPDGSSIYAKAYVWNMDNLKPLAYTFRTANNLNEKISVFSMGDSTMQSYGDLAERQADGKMTGWMQVMPMGTDDNYVEIRNYGRSGKSTKSFTEEGYIFKVYEGMSAGDYLIIQFGHNDQKSNDSTTSYNYAPLESVVANGTVPEAYKDAKTYEQWLREYVAAARMKGAYPVFATSIRRRQFDENGKVKNSHEGYPEAMIELSKELNVPVVDLHSKTQTWMNNLGVDGSYEYYCVSYTGTDNTHVTYAGAVEIANLAIEEIKSIGLPVAQYLSGFSK